MPQREILERSIGFTGPDGTGKTGFALLTIDLLRQNGQKVVFCPFPFLSGTASGSLLRTAKKEGVASVAIFPLYAMNRYEVLPGLKSWVARGIDRWVVTDRVWQDGPVFAEALGLPKEHIEMERRYNRSRGIPTGNEKKEFHDWLHALEVWFPEVEMGFYVTRPLRESLEIMRRRPEAEAVKSSFDRDVRVQRLVRRLFPKEFRGLSNWTTIDVCGVVSGDQAIREWQKPYMIRIWRHISNQAGHSEWAIGGEEMIKIAQQRLLRRRDVSDKEIRNTIQKLSRPSSFTGPLRGVRTWMPEGE